LSKYTGKINIAFKYTGSGKTLLDGAFQVDDVQVFGIKSVNQEGNRKYLKGNSYICSLINKN
jgi:hypothetical protein